MPKIGPFLKAERNYSYIIENLGVIDEVLEGGEHGKVRFLWPWQKVKDEVFTGLVTLQVLRGERRLHFAKGSWIDFAEAVIVTRVVDPLKAATDVHYEDLGGALWHGLDGAAALMRTNTNDALQSFMAGKDLKEAIYLSGPEATENLNLLVPNARIRPEFAAITNETGIEVTHVRFSGVKLSEKYVETMEDIELNIERLNAVKQEREAILQFLRDMLAVEGEPNTLTEAADLFKTISMAEMLQNMNGQLVVAGTNQMAMMWPFLFQMMGGQPPQTPQRGRARNRQSQQRGEEQDQEEE